MKSVIELEWESFSYEIADIVKEQHIDCCFIILENYS